MTLIMFARVGRSMLGQLSAEEFGRTVAGVQAGEARVRRGNHIRQRSGQRAIKPSPAPAAQARRWLRITSLKTLAESASFAERDRWATRWRRVRRHWGNTREPDKAKNLSCDRAGGWRGHAHALGFTETVASDRRVS